ncbi:MAG: hypothetical protein CGU28_04205 [Candidatus Dactylopiibacterium carminicum]|uniref:Uncharacterized protein n=2 Tax=Candidatus Dactylopiibacterium carminicum TaxID=857335 RepID=A0A272EXJ6_9RHOO|nr:hypothetical protein BGI27_03630 [Candidatus Dactylopiibacterium carminicum]PAS94821.1 MAG: hypothetical protein CGU29_02670 [Candidatus Dactylopiibacterium carminicum]PAS97745.1 MAG: hypothetical protein CGU28_04205 [Candidatus Dactylopiibacterium carminicum]PAT00163.1 MAG: hypothetical protein BSR46_03655 [Candidatus Dactylopiibacterium carminicum]
MAGQLAGRHFAPAQLLFLQLALAANAAGILAGAVALYGEVSVQRQLAIDLAARISSTLEEGEDEPGEPIFAQPAWIVRAAEKCCYASLAASLVLWVAFVAMACPSLS